MNSKRYDSFVEGNKNAVNEASKKNTKTKTVFLFTCVC